MPATKPFVAPEQPNLIPASPRHSREGGNPDCMFMLLFPLKRKLTALDSRLRGNDDSHGLPHLLTQYQVKVTLACAAAMRATGTR